MPFPWMAAATAASAISSLGGSIFGSNSTAQGIADTNAANLQIARENRDWQERMDNSKYQRGVEDARKAGFNPLVAFPGSGGTPIPSTPVMQNPKPNRGELFLATARALSELSLIKEQAETEDTKQELNRAEKDRIEGGEASNPLVGRIPLRTLARNIGDFAVGGGTQIGSKIVSTAKQVSDFNKRYTRN